MAEPMDLAEKRAATPSAMIANLMLRAADDPRGVSKLANAIRGSRHSDQRRRRHGNL
jgi:hypothetical protein